MRRSFCAAMVAVVAGAFLPKAQPSRARYCYCGRPAASAYWSPWYVFPEEQNGELMQCYEPVEGAVLAYRCAEHPFEPKEIPVKDVHEARRLNAAARRMV